MADRNILILGASARAAAMSARRAGLIPLAADLFADRDLRAVSQTVQVTDYPRGLEIAAAGFPDCPWLYTGALENDPDLVDRIATRRLLLGNCGPALRAIRDPFQVAAALRGCELPTARLARDRPARGRWLSKRFRSAGGFQIRAFDPHQESAELKTASPGTYYQQQLDGEPIAAIFVAAAGRAVLLGVTRQLIGAPWLAAPRFAYAGSIGPVHLNEPAATQVARIGECLARQFQLRGLFGVDLMWDNHQVFTLEVNPRYTSSVEVLERSLAIDAIKLHVRACRHHELPCDMPDRSSTVSGKAIRYCTANFTMTPASAHFFAAAGRGMDDWPAFADIPSASTTLAEGQPLATALARGASENDVLSELKSRWQSFDSRKT